MTTPTASSRTEHIARLAESWPPLSGEQLDAITRHLPPVSPADEGASSERRAA